MNLWFYEVVHFWLWCNAKDRNCVYTTRSSLYRIRGSEKKFLSILVETFYYYIIFLYNPLIFSTNILMRDTSVSFFSLVYTNIINKNNLQNLALSTIERYRHTIYLKDNFVSTKIDAVFVMVKRIRICGDGTYE